MESQIIGEIEYIKPFQFTFVYEDNRKHTFDNVVKFVAMKTGCYVLFSKDGIIYVIRPLYEYVIEQPQPSE